MADLNAPWPPAPKPDHATITADEVVALLQQEGVPKDRIHLMNLEYSLPTHDWVHGPFASGFTNLVRSLNFTPQADNRNCKDFARLATGYAQYLHSLMPNAGENALAFGEFHFFSNSEGPHAVIFAITENGLEFFEPQITASGMGGFYMQPLALSPEEIESCSFLRP